MRLLPRLAVRAAHLCIRGFNRAIKAGGFTWGDTVVIQGTGPIGILAIAAAQEMGAGRVIASARRRNRA